MDRESLLRELYTAFNARDIDSALAGMTTDVDWPNGWEGCYVKGHEEVRAYWTRQWEALDSRVEPVAFTDRALLFDQHVLHVYAYRGDLVERMTIEATD